MPKKTSKTEKQEPPSQTALPADSQEATLDYKKWRFVEELSKPEPPWTMAHQPGKNTTVHLNVTFPDDISAIRSACESLNYMLTANGYQILDDDSADCTVELARCETSTFEEYVLTTRRNAVTIAANDTEGLRRGIYAFIDSLSAQGGFFPTAASRVVRKPFLSIRLAKSPWGLVKRWPLNQDELLCNDIEFYPDALLDRFAHDAINAVWLVSSLRDLGRCSFCQPSPDREQRLEKLKTLISRTAKFGIRIFLFMIEPFALEENDPIFLEHPSMKGPKAYNGRCTLCPNSPDTRQYLTELITDIFTQLPGLGGILNITIGERPTSCLSTLPLSTPGTLACNAKCHLTPGKILNTLLTTMNDAIHAANPDAKLIAWFYMPHAAPHRPWVKTLLDFVPDDVIAQVNFESGGEKRQLGALHKGVDYWLPYDGPAKPFINAAKHRAGKPFSAKLQLGCGYDLATVPFIPAPGIAYRKYKAMHELGVNSVMQAWYPGNFPGVMTNAMGLLAFTDFENESEDEFLYRLASIYWGSDASLIVNSWKHFDAAYQNFPFNVLFQYYGPLNSAPLWKLNVFPDLEPLAPPWKPTFKIGGDAIGEALGNFSLPEVTDLLIKMSSEWEKGLASIKAILEKYLAFKPRLLDLNVMIAIGILIQNSCKICLFYLLRPCVFTFRDKALLAQMRSCITEFITYNIMLAEYQKVDSRIGFHGEALHYVFDPKSIAESNAYAKKTISLIDKMLKSKLDPMEYLKANTNYTAITPNTHYKDTIAQNRSLNWHYTLNNDILSLHFNISRKIKNVTLTLYFMDMFSICGEFVEIYELDLQQDTVLFKANGHDITDGVKHKSFAERVHLKNGNLTISYLLSEMPCFISKDEMLRFNACLDCQVEEQTVRKLLFGTPYPGRLYKCCMVPRDCALMTLPMAPPYRSANFLWWMQMCDTFNPPSTFNDQDGIQNE